MSVSGTSQASSSSGFSRASSGAASLNTPGTRRAVDPPATRSLSSRDAPSVIFAEASSAAATTSSPRGLEPPSSQGEAASGQNAQSPFEEAATSFIRSEPRSAKTDSLANQAEGDRNDREASVSREPSIFILDPKEEIKDQSKLIEVKEEKIKQIDNLLRVLKSRQGAQSKTLRAKLAHLAYENSTPPDGRISRNVLRQQAHSRLNELKDDITDHVATIDRLLSEIPAELDLVNDIPVSGEATLLRVVQESAQNPLAAAEGEGSEFDADLQEAINSSRREAEELENNLELKLEEQIQKAIEESKKEAFGQLERQGGAGESTAEVGWSAGPTFVRDPETGERLDPDDPGKPRAK